MPGEMDDREMIAALRAVLHDHAATPAVDAAVAELGEAVHHLVRRHMATMASLGEGVALALRVAALTLSETLDLAGQRMGPADEALIRSAARQVFDDMLPDRPAQAIDVGAQPNVAPLFTRLHAVREAAE